jgi:hypothetical protein
MVFVAAIKGPVTLCDLSRPGGMVPLGQLGSWRTREREPRELLWNVV